jgi:hypothetical protein
VAIFAAIPAKSDRLAARFAIDSTLLEICTHWKSDMVTALMTIFSCAVAVTVAASLTSDNWLSAKLFSCCYD